MKLKKIKKELGVIDFQIFWTVIFIVVIGAIMVYSSSAYYALYNNGDSEMFLRKEMLWVVVGIIAMLITMSIDYHKYKKLAFGFYIITVILLILVLFQPDMNGASRWIYLGSLSFQPSEIAKYSIVLFLAMRMDNINKKVKKFIPGLMANLMFAGVFAAFILKEPNLSIAAIIMIVAFLMSFIAGARIDHLVGVSIPLLLGGVVATVTSEYRYKRFLAFLDPWQDASKDSYQLIQSFYALGSGGLFGVGLGESKQKYLYMPEPYNDFIFAIIGEELGLIGVIGIIALFAFLIFRGIVAATRAVDKFGMLLASGIICIIATQLCINIAVVTGLMPVTGVPLPFVSYGGTSLVINLSAMGVLLNISRQARVRKSKETEEIK